MQYVLDKEKLLGMGQFGCVYQATLQQEDFETRVALKTIKDNCPRTAMKNLLSEIKILGHLGKHKNIVSLEGAYTAELSTGIVYVAIELCSKGSLENYLRNYDNNQPRYTIGPEKAGTEIWLLFKMRYFN